MQRHAPQPTFVPGSTFTVSLRSFSATRTCRRARFDVLRVRRTIPCSCDSRNVSTDDGLSDITRLRSDDALSSSQGFALADAKEHAFSVLSADASSFERGGAYAIFNTSGEVVYMGYTKNLSSKLQFHSQLQPQNCVSFRVYIPPVPPELQSPDMFESVLEYWVREIGHVPRGNTTDRAVWENANPVDKQVLYIAIFLLFLVSTIFKQVLYFTTRY